MSELVKRLRYLSGPISSGYELPIAGQALEEAADRIEALEAEADEFERTVMKLELAEERIKALEAMLRKAQDSLEWHSDETSRAIVAEIEKVLK